MWVPNGTGNGTCFYHTNTETLYCKQRTREVNDWDVFLNYFFAVLFMICFLVGVIIDPLIILYHSKQKTTFAKVLFLMISVIDLIRSIYFPVVLVPKLLSPIRFSENSTLEDLEYVGDLYYYEPDSINWTYHANVIVFFLLDFQHEILTTLCVSRYFTFRNPLYTAKKIIFTLCALIIGTFIVNGALLILEYSHGSFGCVTIAHQVISTNLKEYSEKNLTLIVLAKTMQCIFLVIGCVFSGLTILHLKRSDTAACESSEKNVRKGIVAIVAMNVFNIFVIFVAVWNTILALGFSKKLESASKDGHFEAYSTWEDFLIFGGVYGMALAQSAFNALSFLLICNSFRDFIRKIITTRLGVN